MTEISQDETLAILERDRNATMLLIERLAPAARELRGLGGGDWNIIDLLGHIESWEEHVLSAIEAWSLGQVAPIGTALRNGGVDAVNAADLARKALRGYEEQLASTRETRRRLLESIGGIEPGAWASPPEPSMERTMADLLGGLLDGARGPFTHDSAHHDDLQAWVDAHSA